MNESNIQVTRGGGREPRTMHAKVTSLVADNGWSAPASWASSGLTNFTAELHVKIKSKSWQIENKSSETIALSVPPLNGHVDQLLGSCNVAASNDPATLCDSRDLMWPLPLYWCWPIEIIIFTLQYKRRQLFEYTIGRIADVTFYRHLNLCHAQLYFYYISPFCSKQTDLQEFPICIAERLPFFKHTKAENILTIANHIQMKCKSV